MKPHDMITQKIGLNEVEEKGFKTLINDKDNQVKILVEVAGGWRDGHIPAEVPWCQASNASIRMISIVAG